MEATLITRELKKALEHETSPRCLPSLERVDLTCAYITQTGLAELKDSFLALGSRKPPVPVRILTTSQFGTTEPEAIHDLSFLQNVEMKVFRPTHPTLHAKGWHFVHNGEASDVAIVGSSNMTRSAIVTGIEWNICTTADEVTLEFQTVFASYWDGTHEEFKPVLSDGKEVPKMLEYEFQKRDWDSLCALFPSQAEPQCSDRTGSCKHPSCVKLSKELGGLEKRKIEIVETFKKGQKGGPRKRGPPENTWHQYQQPTPKRAKTGMTEVQPSSSTPPPDLMDMDEDDQANPDTEPQNTVIALDSHLRGTPEDLLVHLVEAMLKDDETLVEETIEQARQQSYPILLSWDSNNFIDSILDTIKERREESLEVYDLRSPVLFAIAYSCGPAMINMLIEKGSALGRFSWESDPSRTETIFHVLARLPPGKAPAIFTKIRETLALQDNRRYANYSGPQTALEVAKFTAKSCIPPK